MKDERSVSFFDIDDTLLDYKTSQDIAALEFANKYTRYIDNPEKFPKVWDEITARHMARYLSGELSLQEQRRCRIRESLGLDLSAQESDRVFDEYYPIYEESWRLFPDVKRCVFIKSTERTMTTLFPQLENAHGPFTAVSVGQVNGLPAFARVMQGFEGPYHIHAACDEMFIVLSGIVHLDFESSSVAMGPGQSYTVPAGVKHRSRVPDRAELIVIGGKD